MASDLDKVLLNNSLGDDSSGPSGHGSSDPRNNPLNEASITHGQRALRQSEVLQSGVGNSFQDQELWRPEHELEVTSACFSHDSNLLASGSLGHTVHIWDVSSGKKVRQLEFVDLRSHTTSLCFAHDNKLLATASSDASVKIWETESGRLLQTLCHKLTVDSVCFSADNTLLALWENDHGAMVWNVKSGEKSEELDFLTTAGRISLTSDGNHFQTNFGEVVGLKDSYKGINKLYPTTFGELIGWTNLSYQGIDELFQGAISMRNAWIRRDGNYELYIPQGYREGAVEVRDNVVVIGRSSGGIMILRGER